MSATISTCGLYRYRLEREMNPSVLDAFAAPSPLAGKTVMFVGVNPSTADATLNDATVRKWMGFCHRWGVRRFVVGNAFAYRATDVKALASLRPADAIGAENDWHLMRLAVEADVIVPCWGNTGKVPPSLRPRFGFLAGMLTGAGKPLHCFGLTASGDPKHPLMLGYDTPLIEYAKA
jgi:hypothetical protein